MQEIIKDWADSGLWLTVLRNQDHIQFAQRAASFIVEIGVICMRKTNEHFHHTDGDLDDLVVTPEPEQDHRPVGPHRTMWNIRPARLDRADAFVNHVICKIMCPNKDLGILR